MAHTLSRAGGILIDFEPRRGQYTLLMRNCNSEVRYIIIIIIIAIIAILLVVLLLLLLLSVILLFSFLIIITSTVPPACGAWSPELGHTLGTLGNERLVKEA